MMVLMFLLYDIQGVSKGHQHSINGPYFFPLQKIGKIHKVLRKSHQESYQLKICTIKMLVYYIIQSYFLDITVLVFIYVVIIILVRILQAFPPSILKKLITFQVHMFINRDQYSPESFYRIKCFYGCQYKFLKKEKAHIIRCRYIPDLKDLQTQNDYGFPCHTKC